jgi:hypothetical protein
MGKAKRNKQSNDVQLYTAYNDALMNLALMAAAKALTEVELDRFFQAQEQRLLKLNYSKKVVAETLKSLADSLIALRGDKNDQSRETENVRAN